MSSPVEQPAKRGRGRPRKLPPAPPPAPPPPPAPVEIAPGVPLPAELVSFLSDPGTVRALRREVKKHLSFKKLEQFRAYPKQREFFAAGAGNRTRLLLAANRFGKSHCAAFEMACHLTGHYPPWWTGRRFEHAIEAWCAGENAEMTRNVMQEKLIGPPSRESEWGTGLIPKAALGDHTTLRGVASAIDTISVRHVSGEWSTLQFKAFSQGREKFQGVSLHACWLDEECDFDIFDECRTRLATTQGILFLTFTPLNGYTKLVTHLLSEESTAAVVRATIDDALHFTPEQREEIVRDYAPHMRAARARGEPALGSGAVFPVTREQIECPRRAIPAHWHVLGGIDFGWAHPTAAVKIAHDPDSDVVYVTHCHRAKEMTPVLHAATLRGWGKTLEWAWPHDGANTEKGSGVTLADQYREHGLMMLPERATHPDGGNGVGPGIEMMLERMLTDRLKIFSDLEDIFQEIARLHRKDGRIRAVDDDAVSALRYAMMMLRFASPPTGWGGGAIKRNLKRLA